MDSQGKLATLREQINEIDAKLVPLFLERMAVAKQIGTVKGQNNLAVQDPTREQQVLDRALSFSDQTLQGETTLLMRTIMALAREYQVRQWMHREAPLLAPAAAPATGSIVCAYAGGVNISMWCKKALEKLYPEAGKLELPSSEDVFLAVRQKQAQYGIVHLENSVTGAVGETYDLLRKYGCFISGRTSIDAIPAEATPASEKDRPTYNVFVLISSQPEYNEASDLISISFSTAHRPGALCEALIPFMAMGINILRIDSWPAGADKYRFFADLSGNILDQNMISALRQTASGCEYFEVLGCYSNR